MRTFTISEFAKELKITVHSLRYWEKELELKVKRDDIGYRYYDEQDLITFKKIIELKEKGYKIKGIKRFLEGKESKNTIVKAAMGLENNKIEQFAAFMKMIVNESLEERHKSLREDIRKDMANEIEKSRQFNEALEEKRYKKLDMTLREMQKSRQEIAASQNKKAKRFFIFKKNKS